MELTEKMLESKQLYKGRILDLYKDRVLLPNGYESSREYIKHRGAVAVIAFDEGGKLILEEQYRYPLHDTVLEIPAGKLEPNEDPTEAAFRELEEETGYKAKEMRLLGRMHPTVGYSNEVIYLYLARGLIKTDTHPDEDEFINLIRMDIDKVYELIRNDTLTDGKTLAAIMKYKAICELGE